MHACFDFVGLAVDFSMLERTLRRLKLTEHNGFHWKFQLFPCGFSASHCRASVSRLPSAAFPFVELLLTYWFKFLATSDQVLWLLEVL